MKPFALILASIFFILFIPSVCLANTPTFENNSFEDDVFLWESACISDDYPYSGEKCLSVFPTLSQPGEYPLFRTTYQNTILLKSNHVYEVTFNTRTDFIVNSFSPNCKANVSTEEKLICLSVNNVSIDWSKITVSIWIERTDYYTFSIETLLPSDRASFYIDELMLQEIDFTPAGLSCDGVRIASIPEIGMATYSFFPVVIDHQNPSLPIHNAIITIIEPLPEGVAFSTETGVLTVSTDAASGNSVYLNCIVPGSVTTNPYSFSVLLTNSVLPNGSFEDMPFGSGWDDLEEPIEFISDPDNVYAQIQPQYVSDHVYLSSVSPDHSLVLYASSLYVFRAKVRSNISYTARNIGAQVLGPNQNNVIQFQIANISGKQWNEVSVAFRVPADGVYTISLDLHTPYDSSIFIDDIKIQPEEKEPLSIFFDSPLHIVKPNNEILSIFLNASVLNQSGIPQNEPVSFAVEPENEHVKVENNVLTVSPFAECAEYTIVAFLNNNISQQARRTVEISTSSIFDGSFEDTLPGQAWITAEPSYLSYVTTYKDIYPSDGTRLSRLTMNGSVSMVMSDSVNCYKNGESYVFEADMSMLAPDIDTVVTVLVDNIDSESFDDNLVIGQFKLSKSQKHICHLFSPSQSVTGRVMIAFNTAAEHDQQVIFMDNVSISLAAVYAFSVTVGGTPFVDKNIVGNYNFSSNFNAVDASSYRWLIADSSNGIFMPIPGENDNILSVTPSMLNKYLKFEVTPISLTGPVIGESITSSAILVGEPIPSQPIIPSQPSIPDPIPVPDEPENNNNDYKAELHALDLNLYSSIEKELFYDLVNHWAQNDIALLTAANVVQGRGNGLFEPEAPITRAEFSAILARAFQLAPIYYENLFADVKPSNWFSGIIAVVTKHGITQGTSPTTFSPNLPISREEMAVMIMRAYRKTGAMQIDSAVSYEDSASFSSWAFKDIADASALQLINGMPNGFFMPKTNATRAEAAVVIRRMLTKIKENLYDA